MLVPAISGIIDRRILVNYRIRPQALARVLPPPFRPQLFDGWGIGGICLIRLKRIRPRCLPLVPGLSSENAAHRIAVVWDDDGIEREGVYIPRRDTPARLNQLLGGRLFPGIHHSARFEVDERDDTLAVSVHSDDGEVDMTVEARIAAELPPSSVFGSLGAASEFFERGSLGYSETSVAGTFEGLELECSNWHVEPLAVDRVRSSFFDDTERFPAGTAEFDCALLMRGIEHEWHARESLCCGSAV